MIKNLFYIVTGMYISQEYDKYVPNIKNHLYYIQNVTLQEKIWDIETKNNCPIIKFILKK